MGLGGGVLISGLLPSAMQGQCRFGSFWHLSPQSLWHTADMGSSQMPWIAEHGTLWTADLDLIGGGEIDILCNEQWGDLVNGFQSARCTSCATLPSWCLTASGTTAGSA